jgi:hypothetical protein
MTDDDFRSPYSGRRQDPTLDGAQDTSSNEEQAPLPIQQHMNGHIPPRGDRIYPASNDYWYIPRPRGIWAHVLTASATALIAIAVAGYNGNIIVPPWRSTASESIQRDTQLTADVARLGTEQLRQGAAIMDLGGRIDQVGNQIERLTGFVHGEAAAAAKREAAVVRSLGVIAESRQEEPTSYKPLPKRPSQAKRAAPASGWVARTDRPAS